MRYLVEIPEADGERLLVEAAEAAPEELGLAARRPGVMVAKARESLEQATTSWDNTTRIWDPHTGEQLAMLVPLPDGGWATLLPDGSYKLSGDPGDALWWAVKLCRFAPGELDPYVPGLRRLPDDHPLPPPSLG